MVEKNISLPGFDPLFFFAKLGQREERPAYVVSGEWTIIAWNPSATLRGREDRVLRKLTILQKNRAVPRTSLPFVGGAIGSVSYDGRAFFHIYDHALLWNGKKLLSIGDEDFERSAKEIHDRPMPDIALPKISWTSGMTEKRYKKLFAIVKKQITNGEYYQLNLTYPFFAKSSADHRRLFVEMLRQNPASAASYLEYRRDAVLSLSPERFVTIDAGKITTFPIKGTRPRGNGARDDKKMSEDLLRSEKEAAELNMITDLLRNDIGKVSLPGTVKVLAHRELQRNPSVWHTYSVIQGTIDPVIHPVDAFASMFPGGSITGCPKEAAMGDIRRLERRPRGFYCGSMVLLSDDGYLDSSILIRTVVARKRKLSLGVGGGIVADSKASDEFDETLRKAKSFLEFSDTVTKRVFRNGRQISPDDRSARALDPANRRVKGLFETMLVERKHIRDLNAHLDRLFTSAASIGMKLPASRSRLKNWMTMALRTSKSPMERAKLVVMRTDVFFELRPYIKDPAWKEGVSVTATKLRRKKSGVKALPYHREYKALVAAQSAGFHEALINDRGLIPESVRSNLFWVKKGTLYTANEGMLPGVLRQNVLALAKKEKLSVEFKTATLPDVLSADEIFLTRSLAGIVPVVRINTSVIGHGKPGKVTKALQEALAA